MPIGRGQRLVGANHPVLTVELLEAAVAEPGLVRRGQAVRQRLQQEHRDPPPLPAADDLVAKVRFGAELVGLEQSEAHALASIVDYSQAASSTFRRRS